MDKRTDDGFSPYLTLSRGEWAALREDTPMTLTADEVTRVRSLHDRLDMKEIEEIYLPISRLLSLYVAATQRLFIVQQHFLGTAEAKVPYIIGVAGSVAVGKSTTARVLQALLARWPNTPKVDLVTTDGFLLPNAILEREGLMEKKGFPQSYDLPTLLRFLADVKAGRRPVRAPIYSHLVYDVVPNQWVEVDRPDILIVEGLNVLQAGHFAEGRQGDSVCVGLLRFLGLHRRRGRDAAQVVRRPLPHATPDRVPRSEVLLPSLFKPERQGSEGDRDLDLGADQPDQSARKHRADAPARAPDPEEGSKPPGAGSVAAEALTSS